MAAVHQSSVESVKNGEESGTSYSIGELAAHAGISTDAIRFYEREQVIPRAERIGSGRYRRYTQADASRLRFVRHARELGFSLADVRTLVSLELTDSCTQCDDVGSIARRHLETVRARVTELQQLHLRLQHLIDNCQVGRNGVECGILALLDTGA